MPGLNKIGIEEVVRKIQNIDFAENSIENISQIINNFFDDYHTIASVYEKGIYLNRTRICSKPVNIREVTYPPPDKAVMGRANDKGESIFYASVGKSVPLFELEPEIGDTIIISTWRTTNKMLLNQVGYTKDVEKTLKSARNFENDYGFRKEMINFGEDNETVYNHLAKWFSQKIGNTDKEKYKLTIAIAQRLMSGDMFHGIFYPTVKMFGNADNLALKTTFVDTSLKLVSIEYARIAEKTPDNFKIDILDTSVNWNKDGEIEWSGRMLGWTIPGHSTQKMVSDGDEWIAMDERDIRVDPFPTKIIDIDPTPLLYKFKMAYPTTIKNEGDSLIEGLGENVTIRVAIHLDMKAKEKYLSFYIPHCELPFEVAKYLTNSYDKFFNIGGNDLEITSRDKKGIAPTVSSKEAINIKFIHIFSEDYIDELALRRQMIPGYDLRMECANFRPTNIGCNYIFRPAN